MKKRTFVATAMVVGSAMVSSIVEASGPPDFPKKGESELVTWTGEVRDDASTHTTAHVHFLRFFRREDGSAYEIQSPKLEKLHHDTDKNYLVEIEAEKTPEYLLSSSKLIVRKFKVLSELGDAVPLAEPVRREIMR